MLISLDWLADYYPAVHKVQDLSQLFTDRGLEVESCSKAGPELPGIVAAKITAAKKIDGKRRLCTIDYGAQGTVQTICTAPNAKVGGKYAYAPAGSQLPDGREIGTVERDGITSSGMLCSAAELQISDDASGLLMLDRNAKPGSALANIMHLDDLVYDLSITPNRGDWLSMRGVARELAALHDAKIGSLSTALPAGHSDEKFPVSIADDALASCPRFCAVTVSGVNAKARSPLWLTERLRRCGVRPISAIVDITNYVMLAVGQPIHAFDRSKLGSNINIRFARAGEQLALLDGTEAKLKSHMLLVCGDDKPAALGGVMGGLNSGVTEATADIVLEAAHFVPPVVRGRTRELNIFSEAAFRFERGVDPALPPAALALAAKLVKRICGGKVGTLAQAGSVPPAADPIALPHGKVGAVLGFDPGPAAAKRILTKLGFKTQSVSKEKKLLATPPSWRFDAQLAEDLIEEIVRFAGYDQVPTTMPRLEGRFLPQPEMRLDPLATKQRLASEGFAETVTFAFVPPAWENDFYRRKNPLALANPLSEQASALRSGLLASLVDRAAYNFNRNQQAVRLFELSRCFPPDDPRQPVMLAALACGPLQPDHWDGEQRAQDFFDLKGVLARILGLKIGNLDLAGSDKHPALHPGKAAQVSFRSRQLGFIGEIHPRLAESYGLIHPCAVFELDFEACAGIAASRAAQKISRLPLVRRDIAVAVDVDVPAGQLVESVRMLAIEEIIAIDIFDSYTGQQVAAGKKSIGLRLTLQGSTTNLVDASIDAIVNAVSSELARKHRAAARS